MKSRICTWQIFLLLALAQLTFAQRAQPKDQLTNAFVTIAAYTPEPTSTNWNYPYAFFLLHSRFTHLFTDPENKTQKISGGFNGELSPLWVKLGTEFKVSPHPILSVALGADAATGWNVHSGSTDVQSIGVYNVSKVKYEDSDPFATWLYDAYVQGTFLFDFGFLLPGDKRHLLFIENYKTTYTGLTDAKNGEMWTFIKSNDGFVNGITYEASTTLSYILPYQYIKRLEVSAIFSGYYSSRFFDDCYGNYDKTFTTISFTPRISGNVGPQNIFSFIVPVSSKRDYIDEDDDLDDEPLIKSSGRKWYWGGVMLLFTHLF